MQTVKQNGTNIKNKLVALRSLYKTHLDFVSIVSHELKTPLAVVKESVLLLQEGIAGSLNRKQKDILSRAKNNIEYLALIIDQLLDMSKIQEGKFKLHYSLVNFADLLKDSSRFFKIAARKRGIRLRYSVPKKQINTFIDAARINQVITNLINNALKFTQKSGEVTVDVKILDDVIQVGIFDNGIGIAKQDIPKLFSRFTQLSRETGAQIRSLGLGLSISKELIERHGGEIWVESKLGVGSKFYFILPRFYTTHVLDENLRAKINSILRKGMFLYMVNILIMNSSQFHKAIQLSPERLFEDFKSLIETVLSRFSRQTEEKPELAVIDSCHGECSILLPNATDKLSSDMCKALKESIRSYFAKKNAKSVFVNIASLLLSPFGKPVPMHEVSANLNIKQVYIGTETRLAQRVRYLAHIDVLLAPGKKEPTRTIDISKGGLCFTSQIPFKINSEIKISLKLPIYPKPIPIKGRVAWIKETGSLEPENLTTYKLGVEFVHLKKRYRRNISRFMDSLLS